jgi:hypothetical protein
MGNCTAMDFTILHQDDYDRVGEMKAFITNVVKNLSSATTDDRNTASKYSNLLVEWHRGKLNAMELPSQGSTHLHKIDII